MSTILINLFGGPCAGKSTLRADVFRLLKQQGVNCEEVYEHAKKLTWSARKKELSCQPYILGKQLRDMEILQGQVDVIITDSPLLLCAYYTKKYRPDAYPPAFHEFVVQHFHRMGGMNYFIQRVGPYNPVGRNQTEAEANEAAYEIESMLLASDVEFDVIPGDVNAAVRIVDDILVTLGRKKLPNRFGRLTQKLGRLLRAA